MVLAPAALGAQAAQIGRLPLFAELASGKALCKAMPVASALRNAGIVQLWMLNDSAGGRMLSLGLDAYKRPVTLIVIASTKEGARSEAEMANVIFSATGKVDHGTRSAYTGGTPATRADDRRGGLLKADSAQALVLARAVGRRCDV
jgi:hypothetical protein